MKKFTLLLSALFILGMFISCGTTNQIEAEEQQAVEETVVETSAAEPVTVTESEPEAVSGKLIVPDETNVKLLGRTFKKNDDIWFVQSASGIEFNVNAKKLVLKLKGDSTSRAMKKKDGANQARYEIFVDGELFQTGMMEKKSVEVPVFEGEENKSAVVRIVKITEAAQSHMAISSILVDDDGTISPTEEKDLKIEFIGDSITCGYGVEALNANEHFSTATQNAAKTYAYEASTLLDADYSFVSFSGFGIVSGYTGTGERNTASLLPPIYEKLTFSWGNNSFNKEMWDFSKFVPDVVVINLGTNDASYTKGSMKKSAEFIEGYVAFLKQVRALNPDATIICALGIMGDDLFNKIQVAVENYCDETGDDDITTLHFPVQNTGDGIGADWHPSEKTQKKDGKLLADFITELFAE